MRYIEIKEELLKEIYKMDTNIKIPSRAKLCKRYLSTRTTIDRAISELIGEGYLYSKSGSGTYVADLSSEMNIHEDVENWGVIVPNIMKDTYPGILRGIEDFAQSKNINVVYCNSDNDAEKQYKYIQRLIATEVKGLIIVPTIGMDVQNGGYKHLVENSIPVVFCNRGVEGLNIPLVTSNNFYGGYIATKHLIEKGYKKIGYIAKDLYKASMDRYEGYVAAITEEGIPLEEELIVIESQMQVREEDDTLGIKKLMDCQEKPDAIFCFNDAIGIRVMDYLQKEGYKIPGDVGIIAYDNTEVCNVLKPKLTSVSYRTEEVGRKAAEILYQVIKGEEVNKFNIFLFQPEIVIRESCIGKKDK